MPMGSGARTCAADLGEHIARLAWAAAKPFLRKPLLRVAIIRPLGIITSNLNLLGASDRHFQVGRRTRRHVVGQV